MRGEQGRRLGTDTRAVHAGRRNDPSGALVEPIFLTAPFTFAGTEAREKAATGEPPDAFYTRE